MNSRPDAPRDGVLVVVGSGIRLYREYLLAGAAREHPLWLFDSREPSWQTPYLAGSTLVDTSDPRALVDAATALAATRPVDGVLCYTEALVEPAAAIVDSLGLPGMSREAVSVCRDKGRTRRRLAEAGVGQPRFAAVPSLDEAARAAEAIGYPVVLKPRGLAGSLGVVHVPGPADLARAYREATAPSYPGVPTYDAPVLVEEYADGPEISVDGLLADGVYRPLVLARKRVAMPPYFEEEGHLVDAADPLLTSPELLAFLTDVHRALGATGSLTHTELRLTAKGPRLIEVNARLGGGLIPLLGRLAGGVDPGRAGARAALGLPVDAAGPEPAGEGRAGGRVAAVHFSYPAEDCTVEAVRLPEEGAVPGLHHAAALAEPGDVLRLPPRGYISRYAYAICVADTVEECEESVALARAAVRLDHRPAPAFDPDAGPELAWSTAPPSPAPEGAAPDGIAPEGAAPEGAAPGGTAPEGAAPEGAAPGGTAPDGTTPQAASAPEGPAPVAGAAPGGAVR
ncbi:ATP-grasp domain-containing protein [Streptomyces fradiae]|uniref:ATP-grasp domain-containing protein n=1 Tax=Streptomyces fradiae TaxID=1906 RepID=UPI00380C6561